MARREFLSPAQRAQFLAFPTSQRDLIRFYTFSPSELAWIQKRRGEHNRLGFALQLCFFKYPGRVWALGESIPDELLRYVAQQINVKPAALAGYAQREPTRREHILELQARLGWQRFSGRCYREMKEWLIAPARATDRSLALIEALSEELRRRRLLAPAATVLERLARETRRRARFELYRTLSAQLSDAQRKRLDGLLDSKPGSRHTVLVGLRESGVPATANNISQRLQQLHSLRALGIPLEWQQLVHPNRLKQLAREGLRVSVNHLRQYEPEHRWATLVAIVLHSMVNLIDEILEMHERLIGGYFKKAERAHLESFQANGRAINEKVRLYSRVGRALIDARQHAVDPFVAIEAVVSWNDFLASVTEAEQLAGPEDFDYLERVGDYYPQIRRYAPTLLECFTFQPSAASEDLKSALDVLRQVNAEGKRDLPENVPLSFVRPRWSKHVVTEDGIDRRFYELAALSELSHALRSGDLSVEGSRQYRDFNEYLIDRETFHAQLREQALPLAVEPDFETYFKSRTALLDAELQRVNFLATQGALPDAEIADGVLKVVPIVSQGSDEIDYWSERAYSILPRIRITDLLWEVDHWTGFTQRFTHLRSGETTPEIRLLLTAILADAINLGPTRMAFACPGTSLPRLIQTADWYIREETYSQALAELVNHHHQLPLALEWGKGSTSSSDAQRFPAGAQGEATGRVNARYGNVPSVLFYTHVSDQYAPFFSKVIHATIRDATHVLDGLLYHETDLKIEEHYTDTAGFTDHVFALCHLLGFRFAPRIRDLADKRLYTGQKPHHYPALAGLIGGTLNRKLVERHWGEILRLATSIQRGTVTASLMLRKLGAYPRQNSLAQALRELGRLERTFFTLYWLQDLELRQRVHAGLNKGESRNALARAVFFHRLGEVRERSYEDQRYRASGLNLVVAAIVLWNTVYLDRAVQELTMHGAQLPDKLTAHLSPLGWSHINLTGDYVWRSDGGVKPGNMRPLRPLPPDGLAKA